MRCGRCEKDLPEAAFAKRNGKYQPWCKPCAREYRRETYKKQKELRQELIEKEEEFKKNFKCNICGEEDPRVLTWEKVTEPVILNSWDSYFTNVVVAQRILCLNCFTKEKYNA